MVGKVIIFGIFERSSSTILRLAKKITSLTVIELTNSGIYVDCVVINLLYYFN